MEAVTAVLAKTGPDPLPTWLQAAIVIALVVVGAFFVLVMAFGIAYRRDPR
jgi:hypothetical protein